jgi:hypothetical protein
MLGDDADVASDDPPESSVTFRPRDAVQADVHAPQKGVHSFVRRIVFAMSVIQKVT